FYALDRLWKDTPAIDLGLPEESTRPDAAAQDDGASASHAS
ncbi:ribosome silencing factor, partial [Xanthomonas citri pv. citri]|nr:ribosome silencing factor [Xanthomonas citri pv. citri]